MRHLWGCSRIWSNGTIHHNGYWLRGEPSADAAGDRDALEDAQEGAGAQQAAGLPTGAAEAEAQDRAVQRKGASAICIGWPSTNASCGFRRTKNKDSCSPSVAFEPARSGAKAGLISSMNSLLLAGSARQGTGTHHTHPPLRANSPGRGGDILGPGARPPSSVR